MQHDALHYDIALSLPDTGSVFSADVSIRWKLGGQGPIRLDLDSSLALRSAEVNGVATRARRIGNRLEIPVAGRAGSSITTRVRYDGRPRDGLLFAGEGATRRIFADNWPERARYWLASHDHPSDKATVSWSIEAPAGYGVVAAGTLERLDTLASGRLRWRFQNPEPLPVYTMVLGMARFAVTALPPACALRCVPVSVLSYAEDSAFAMGGPFRRANQIVDFFSARIAPFPYRELRHVESLTRFGGMENATAIFYDEKAYRARRLREAIVAHETMHQWFGDAVTESDWHDVWLSEGFASYGEAIWAEHVAGDSGLRAAMQGFKNTVLLSKVTERPILDSTESNPNAMLNSNSYQKGAWVLHSLRGILGDSAFFRGLRAYYRTFEHGNALSGDFARVMGQAAHQELGWYFRQALRQPGYPVLRVQTELDAGHLLLTIRQVQPSRYGLYRMPNLRIRLDDRVISVAVRGAVTRLATHWESERGPQMVEVDPEGWWLVKSSEP